MQYTIQHRTVLVMLPTYMYDCIQSVMEAECGRTVVSQRGASRRAVTQCRRVLATATRDASVHQIALCGIMAPASPSTIAEVRRQYKASLTMQVTNGSGMHCAGKWLHLTLSSEQLLTLSKSIQLYDKKRFIVCHNNTILSCV